MQKKISFSLFHLVLRRLWIAITTHSVLSCMYMCLSSVTAMVAEVVAHYFPKIVEVHNYPACGSVKLKVDNWIVLNRCVTLPLYTIIVYFENCRQEAESTLDVTNVTCSLKVAMTQHLNINVHVVQRVFIKS